MRRFWLLLLAFVLPMQMSWAATHFCNDDVAPIVAAVAGDGKGAHTHTKPAEAGKKSDSKKSDQLADCCAAAHGCQGLHHLMGHSEALLPSAGQSDVAAPRDAPSKCGFLVTRVERPKWPVA